MSGVRNCGPWALAVMVGAIIVGAPTALKAVAAEKPTYHKDVAPILQTHCESCHRPGQVAPFTLTSYADARRWGVELKEFTHKGLMPPWKPEAGFGEFVDPRVMSDAEVKTIARWVDSGMPEGNVADAPKPREWVEGWNLGKPDKELTVPEPYTVPGGGDDEFRCFVMPLGNEEPVTLSAIDFRPGNSRVVHHFIAVIDTTGAARKLDAADPASGYSTGQGGFGFAPQAYLGAWAPGNFPRRLPDGIGRRIPKNADLVLQVHYHKTGKEETDQSRLGLYYGKSGQVRQLMTSFYGSVNIDIPANEKNHEIRYSHTLVTDLTILNIMPHMHLLGKEMKVQAVLPDESVRPLIWIRKWDYRWQDTYRFKEPVFLPKGTRIEQVAYYDNSSDNPLNPSNPPKRVRWGEQTTDEMCFAIFDFVLGTLPAAP